MLLSEAARLMAAVVRRTSSRLFRTVAMPSPCRERETSHQRENPDDSTLIQIKYVSPPCTARRQANNAALKQPVPRLIAKATATAWAPPSAIDSAAGLCSDGPALLANSYE